MSHDDLKSENLDLARTLQAVNDRLSDIETRLDSGLREPHPQPQSSPTVDQADQTQSQDTPAPAQGLGPDSNQPSSIAYDSDNAFLDIQRQFESLRDRLSRIQIPSYCKVNDSAVGIKSECKPTLKVITKSARFAETGLRVLAVLQGPHQGQYTLTENDLQSIYTIFYAQVNYLQSEYSNLVVRSTFDDETGRLFRSFENNTQAFSQRSLTNVRLTAELSALSNRTSSRSSTNSRTNTFRGRGQTFNAAHSYPRQPYQFYISRGSPRMDFATTRRDDA